MNKWVAQGVASDPHNFSAYLLLLTAVTKWLQFQFAIQMCNFILVQWITYYCLKLSKEMYHFVRQLVWSGTEGPQLVKSVGSLCRGFEKVRWGLLLVLLKLVEEVFGLKGLILGFLGVSKVLYIPSTVDIHLIQWHTQLIVYAVKCLIMV